MLSSLASEDPGGVSESCGEEQGGVLQSPATPFVSFLRSRVLFSLPSIPLSLAAAVSAIQATLSSLHSTPTTVRSVAIFVYAILLASSFASLEWRVAVLNSGDRVGCGDAPNGGAGTRPGGLPLRRGWAGRRSGSDARDGGLQWERYKLSILLVFFF